MKRIILLCALVASVASLAGSSPAAVDKPIRVLVLGGTPQSIAHNFYDVVPLAALLSETYLNPLALGDPEITGRRVRYHTPAEWNEALNQLDRYDVVVIWDVPRQLVRGGETLDILSDDAMARLAAFVKAGGGLVVNGGVSCYGTGNQLGASSAKTKAAADKLIYVGWQGTKLAEILPVTWPAPYSLEADLTSFRPVTAGRDYNVAGYGEATNSLVQGLAWAKRPGTSAHFLQAKPDATVLLTAQFGKAKQERPLIVAQSVGKGHVVAFAFSAAAQVHEAHHFWSQVFWSDDPVLWDRAVKWAAGRATVNDEALEDRVRAKFSQELLAYNGEKSLPEWLFAEFPLSVRVLEVDNSGGDPQAQVFRFFKDLGFPRLTTCPPTTNAAASAVYSAERADVLLMQSLNPVNSPQQEKLKPEQTSQVLNTGAISTSYYNGSAPCPRNPKYLEAAGRWCARYRDATGIAPRVAAYMLDDELDFEMGFVPEKGIACYCDSCKAFYKERTGNDAPLAVFREPGYVAPANDPWMLWERIVRENAYDPYQAAMAKILKEKMPWVKVTGYPGGYYGGLDVIDEEYYLDYWTASDLTAMQRSDNRFATVNDMAGAKHELWGMLALLRHMEDDIRSGVSQETLRLTSGCMLGSGVRGIHLWASPWLTKCPGEFGKEALWVEAAALAQKLKVFGPMFRVLTRAEAPVWMMAGWLHTNPHDAYLLLPLPTPERRKADPEWPWSQYFAEDVAYPALMRAGVQVQAMTSRQLMTDDLFKKKAVVLPRLWYAEQPWLDRLQEFIKKGGKVFVDESCKIEIPGSIRLPVDFDRYHRDVVDGKRKYGNYDEYMASWRVREALVDDAIPALKKQVAAAAAGLVTIDSDHGVFSVMENGDARYLFVFNQDKFAPHSFTVQLNDPVAALYDLGVDRAGEPLPSRPVTGPAVHTGDMPAGGWKVYLLAPQPLASLQATAKVTDDGFAATVTVLGKDGQPVRAAIPLRIELRRQNQEPLVFYRTTDAGKASVEIPLKQYAAAVTEAAITELVTGQSVTRQLR